MNAVIDIGNTQVKIGLLDNEYLITILTLPYKETLNFLKLNKVLKVLVSNVSENASLIALIKKTVPKFNLLSIDTPMPISTSYATPQSIGVDRLAACVGARNHTKENVLVIDAGSCITYDVLTKDNEHLGGIITPGLNMRLRAMHTLTANLPLVSFNKVPIIGNSTEKCLQSGASNGTLAEMKGLIKGFQGEFENLSIIIGGGDAVFFDKNLELNTFVVSNLAVEGLHAIFKYNE